MKVKFYLVLPVYFLFMGRSEAQNCSGLSISYSSTESRCVATGSITVTVNGGSGNYNFKASGPVTTPNTSSNVLTGLPSGYYTITVKDLTTNCTVVRDSAFIAGSYSDPRFQLTKTDAGCAGNNGTLTVINQQFGRAPYTYTIISPSPSNVGATNNSGIFTGLTPGEYVVQLQDSCGGQQVRRITIENYNWWIDSVSVVRTGCVNANVYIRLRDNKGNVNTSGSSFSGFSYGYVLNPGDTTWLSAYQFAVALGTKRNLPLVIKDNCGIIHATTWYLPPADKPSLSSVIISNLACSTLTASVTGLNLTSPQFCLYNSSNVLLSCNTTGTFPAIGYGSYCIRMTDACYDTIISRCFTTTQPMPSVGATVAISNKLCSGFTATITGQQNLISPTYCIYNSAGVLVSCNSTGVFTNLTYGSYCIQVQDGCTGTVISRCFYVPKPVPTLTGYTISGSTCGSFSITATGDSLTSPTYCLVDNLGNIVTCNSTGIFSGITHGSYCIRALSCGDSTNTICFTSASPVPAIGATVQISNKVCSTFTASITGAINLTSPQFCLYTNTDSLIGCNTTGVFTGIAYGSYCIIMKDGCKDTLIKRCFSAAGNLPSVNATLQVLSRTCSTVSFKAQGSNLTTPDYCLYNASNSLLECNTTGTFNNYPYGSYCVKVEDGCVDTTMTVCQTFAPLKGISLTTSKSCTIGNSFIDIQFNSASSPYTVSAYHPNGTLVLSTSTSTNPVHIQLPALPSGTQYKIVGQDNCGNLDSAFIAPDANVVTRSIQVRSKCPGSVWLNGAGDILTTIQTNYYAVLPQIIRKNGIAYWSSYSSVTGNVYTFSDLEPGQYVIQYTQQTCNGSLYDTVTVSPYTYPTQGQSAIYQCDNNSFSLGADVQGGVTPFSFQIIGSLPESPGIATPPQTSAVFNINTGTTYSLVRLRSIDACGNATLNDVSVLPLQNVSIAASQLCFFQNVILSVDTIPNAVYTWYKKNSATDSTLIGTGTSYNFPFFTPAEMGRYVCKVVVNNGCITRVSSFMLDGICDYTILPASFSITGSRTEDGNLISWTDHQPSGYLNYVIERKREQDNTYKPLGSLPVQSSGVYSFIDPAPGNGLNLYRVKLVYSNKVEYTNIVPLRNSFPQFSVYPNPVRDRLSISTGAAKNVQVEIVSASGQLIYQKEIKNNNSTLVNWYRNNKIPRGMYLVRVTDKDTGVVEVFRLLFE